MARSARDRATPFFVPGRRPSSPSPSGSSSCTIACASRLDVQRGRVLPVTDNGGDPRNAEIKAFVDVPESVTSQFAFAGLAAFR